MKNKIQTYIIFQNGKYNTVRADHRPVYFVTGKIENDEGDINVLDIVDDIDPDTLKIIGKKAIINSAKVVAKNMSLQAKLTAQASKDQEREERRQRIRDAYVNFSALSAEGKDDLLKDLIKGAGYVG